MDQDQLNKIRRMAGLPDSYNAQERRHLTEKAAGKQEQLSEAANNRAPANKMAEIARQHLHVRTLDKSGDDSKDYHDLPVWAIENALKAAYKAGVESVKSQPVKESDTSAEESKKGGHDPAYDPKGGAREYKDGEDKVEKSHQSEEHKKRKGLEKGKASTGYNTPKNKSAKQVSERHEDYDDHDLDHYDDDNVDELATYVCPECEGEGEVEGYFCKHCDGEGMVSESKSVESPPVRDVVDWSNVLEAGKKTAKDVHGSVDMKKLQGIIANAKKHKPDSTGEAVELVQGMLRSEKKNVSEASGRLEHLLDQEKKLKMQLMGARNATEEANIENTLDHVRSEIAKEKGGYTAEGSSEKYNPPKGTKMDADPSSGAKKDVPNAYEKKPHKSDSHDAESKDKGTKLKKIGEGETKLSKDYRNQPEGEVYKKSSGEDYGKDRKNAYTTVVHKDDNIPGSNETVEKRPGSGAKDKGELPNAYDSDKSPKNTSINYGYEEVKKNARAGLKSIGEATEWYNVDYDGKYQGGVTVKATDEEDAKAKAKKRIPEGCEVTTAKKAPTKGKVDESTETPYGKDYNLDGRVDKDESPDMFQHDPMHEMKVNVPASYTSRLQTTINELRKEADKVRVRDPYGSEFYDNTALAFENLLEHLKTGTKHSLLMAQIDLNRIMSPMIQRLPNEVYMFIVRGGKPAALTELFKEVKIKKDGADLSKEKLTK